MSTASVRDRYPPRSAHRIPLDGEQQLLDHIRCCLWETKSIPRQGRRQDGQVAAYIGNGNPLSGLCKANTPVKVTLPAPHIFRGKEGLYQELLKRCPLEGAVHCHPGKLKDNKESLTVQTLHSQV